MSTNPIPNAMVSSTANPRLWRVDFEIQHSPTSKAAVVCYLHLTPAGIRLYYHHHDLFSRPVPKGHWEPPTSVVQQLDHTLKALIEAGIYQAVWTLARAQEVELWPSSHDTPVGEVDLDP